MSRSVVFVSYKASIDSTGRFALLWRMSKDSGDGPGLFAIDLMVFRSADFRSGVTPTLARRLPLRHSDLTYKYERKPVNALTAASASSAAALNTDSMVQYVQRTLALQRFNDVSMYLPSFSLPEDVTVVYLVFTARITPSADDIQFVSQGIRQGTIDPAIRNPITPASATGPASLLITSFAWVPQIIAQILTRVDTTQQGTPEDARAFDVSRLAPLLDLTTSPGGGTTVVDAAGLLGHRLFETPDLYYAPLVHRDVLPLYLAPPLSDGELRSALIVASHRAFLMQFSEVAASHSAPAPVLTLTAWAKPSRPAIVWMDVQVQPRIFRASDLSPELLALFHTNQSSRANTATVRGVAVMSLSVGRRGHSGDGDSGGDIDGMGAEGYHASALRRRSREAWAMDTRSSTSSWELEGDVDGDDDDEADDDAGGERAGHDARLGVVFDPHMVSSLRIRRRGPGEHGSHGGHGATPPAFGTEPQTLELLLPPSFQPTFRVQLPAAERAEAAPQDLSTAGTFASSASASAPATAADHPFGRDAPGTGTSTSSPSASTSVNSTDGGAVSTSSSPASLASGFFTLASWERFSTFVAESAESAMQSAFAIARTVPSPNYPDLASGATAGNHTSAALPSVVTTAEQDLHVEASARSEPTARSGPAEQPSVPAPVPAPVPSSPAAASWEAWRMGGEPEVDGPSLWTRGAELARDWQRFRRDERGQLRLRTLQPELIPVVPTGSATPTGRSTPTPSSSLAARNRSRTQSTLATGSNDTTSTPITPATLFNANFPVRRYMMSMWNRSTTSNTVDQSLLFPQQGANSTVFFLDTLIYAINYPQPSSGNRPLRLADEEGPDVTDQGRPMGVYSATAETSGTSSASGTSRAGRGEDNGTGSAGSSTGSANNGTGSGTRERMNSRFAQHRFNVLDSAAGTISTTTADGTTITASTTATTANLTDASQQPYYVLLYQFIYADVTGAIKATDWAAWGMQLPPLSLARSADFIPAPARFVPEFKPVQPTPFPTVTSTIPGVFDIAVPIVNSAAPITRAPAPSPPAPSTPSVNTRPSLPVAPPSPRVPPLGNQTNGTAPVQTQVRNDTASNNTSPITSSNGLPTSPRVPGLGWNVTWFLLVYDPSSSALVRHNVVPALLEPSALSASMQWDQIQSGTSGMKPFYFVIEFVPSIVLEETGSVSDVTVSIRVNERDIGTFDMTATDAPSSAPAPSLVETPLHSFVSSAAFFVPYFGRRYLSPLLQIFPNDLVTYSFRYTAQPKPEYIPSSGNWTDEFSPRTVRTATFPWPGMAAVSSMAVPYAAVTPDPAVLRTAPTFKYSIKFRNTVPIGRLALHMNVGRFSAQTGGILGLPPIEPGICRSTSEGLPLRGQTNVWARRALMPMLTAAASPAAAAEANLGAMRLVLMSALPSALGGTGVGSNLVAGTTDVQDVLTALSAYIVRNLPLLLEEWWYFDNLKNSSLTALYFSPGSAGFADLIPFPDPDPGITLRANPDEDVLIYSFTMWPLHDPSTPFVTPSYIFSPDTYTTTGRSLGFSIATPALQVCT